MKLIQFKEIPKAEIEKEAFDITTNNGRASLLQDLLKGAERVEKDLNSTEGLVFLKQIDGNSIKFEVVNRAS